MTLRDSQILHSVNQLCVPLAYCALFLTMHRLGLARSVLGTVVRDTPDRRTNRCNLKDVTINSTCAPMEEPCSL
jgi:hypothetical protein